MYKLSYWASQHVWPARLILVVGFIFLNTLAIFIGTTLQLLQVSVPLFLFYGSVVLFLLVFLIYPDKINRTRFKNFYRYQKTCDVLLLAATFFFLISIGNRPEALLQPALPAAASMPNTKTNLQPNTEKKEISIQPSLTKKFSKKALKHALVTKIKQLRKTYKDTSTGGKIALIALAVIVALGLFYLLAAVACSISCSGSDGLAILVSVLGTVLIVFLLVRVIHRITKGPRQKPASPKAAT